MDIYIVLTGKKGHGKDTVADIAIKDFGCAGKVGLATWFKELLSAEFGIPLNHFHDTELKDKDFDKPVTVTRKNLRNFLLKLSWLGFPATHRISTMRWEGRQLRSIRDMMLWFGHDFVTQSCGDLFHCKVTEEQKIPSIERKPDHANIIIVTDARKHAQSKYFKDRFRYAFPVLVTRPNGSNDSHRVEKSVDEFPDGYFFAKINNDGTIEDLKEKVHKLLLVVKKAVTAGEEPKTKEARPKVSKTKKAETNQQ